MQLELGMISLISWWKLGTPSPSHNYNLMHGGGYRIVGVELSW